MERSAIVLRCEECGLPFARLVNGVLIIQSKHHGSTHTNVVAIAELERLDRRGEEVSADGDGEQD